jgi:NDP-sugar pyrophosphorylase family protein
MTSKIEETAQIHLLTALGQNIKIGAYAVIHEGVTLEDNVQIGDHAVLGKPVTANAYNDPSGFKYEITSSSNLSTSEPIIKSALSTTFFIAASIAF